jgi:vacuolar-type H+-ATPase subunit E/Vma4
MSLDRLLQEIQSRADQAMQKEKDRIESEKGKIQQELQHRVRQIREEAERQAQAAAQRERSRIIASARLQAKRLEYEAREAEAREFLDAVRAELGALTRTPEYPKLLKRLYGYATDRLGKELRLQGRAEDAKLLKALHPSAFDEAPLPVIGGFVASTADGARRLNLTFDELLRLREPRLRGLLPS